MDHQLLSSDGKITWGAFSPILFGQLSRKNPLLLILSTPRDQVHRKISTAYTLIRGRNRSTGKGTRAQKKADRLKIMAAVILDACTRYSGILFGFRANFLKPSGRKAVDSTEQFTDKKKKQ